MDKRNLKNLLTGICVAFLVAGVMVNSVLVANMGAKYQSEVQQVNVLHRGMDSTRQDLVNSDKQVSTLKSQVERQQQELKAAQQTIKAQATKIQNLEKGGTNAPF